MWPSLSLLSDIFLMVPGILVAVISIILSFKTRFIQLRAIPQMLKSIFAKPGKEGSKTIVPRQALFTAMSTTIGTASMAAPVLAIRIGGPGALLGFMFATFFGAAANYIEVTLALAYRKKMPDGTIMGGPMQYLQALSPRFAWWYAVGALWLLVVWSTAQANIVADIMTTYYVPTWLTGLVLAVVVTYALFGGIKRIGAISEKIVPIMFVLYTGAAGYIILCNITILPQIFRIMIDSVFSRDALVGASVATGFYQAMRWGVIRGFQANEAGIGTATIPHSMAETNSPTTQGVLSMASTYAHGIICLMSGLVTLITGTWNDPNIAFGINIVSTSFFMYFSYLGPLLLLVSLILFGYGTILGNGYNGSQCLNYVASTRYLPAYYLATGALVFLGAVLDIRLVWEVSDYFMVPVATPHMIALLILAFRRRDLFRPN